MRIVKQFCDVFVSPILNKLDTPEFDNIYLNYNHELHKNYYLHIKVIVLISSKVVLTS